MSGILSRTHFASVFTLLCVLCTAGTGQQRQPLVKIPLFLSDGVATATLSFGLDPEATDSLDAFLGESELPPLPPQEVFDARFVGFDIQIPLGLGSKDDFRSGDTLTIGTRVHELMYQTAPGRTVTIGWDLPAGISAVLEDVYQGTIIRVSMIDSGQYTVQNPSVFNRLKMTVQYNLAAAVGLEEPAGFLLFQNYPNPFNPTTRIRFWLPEISHVRLSVVTTGGQQAALLRDTVYDRGEHEVLFDASELASGAYFCRIEAASFVRHLAMTVLK